MVSHIISRIPKTAVVAERQIGLKDIKYNANLTENGAFECTSASESDQTLTKIFPVPVMIKFVSNIDSDNKINLKRTFRRRTSGTQ